MMLKGFDEYVESLECRYFNKDKQAKLFVQERHLPRLRKLLEFEFKQHPKYPIEDKTLRLMSKLVQERARKIINIYHDKTAEIRRILTEK